MKTYKSLSQKLKLDRNKVGKKSVHDVDGIPKGTTTSNPDAPKGTKVIRNKRSGHSVFLDPEHAKRAQYTPKPTIRKRK